jgi:hypothetical protein
MMPRVATIVRILIMAVIAGMAITNITATAGKDMAAVTGIVTNPGNTTKAAICGLFVILLL